MTAQPVEAAPAEDTRLAEQLRRVRLAASDLEDALSTVEDAARALEATGAHECDCGSCWAGDDEDTAAGELAQLVLTEHEDERHDGPARFCTRAACRLADELTNGRWLW